MVMTTDRRRANRISKDSREQRCHREMTSSCMLVWWLRKSGGPDSVTSFRMSIIMWRNERKKMRSRPFSRSMFASSLLASSISASLSEKEI